MCRVKRHCSPGVPLVVVLGSSMFAVAPTLVLYAYRNAPSSEEWAQRRGIQ
ncbi:hypothetical protein FHX76_000184 [Lysinibacter cavernae]|uniref:Uncharacterized protein n=1 Tax=Lysinibacter cavernae TaxID=1640652 RepID=A0A7X5QYK6_9MICO|nr:hypothetical protein [Lysinibacter cavernae]